MAEPDDIRELHEFLAGLADRTISAVDALREEVAADRKRDDARLARLEERLDCLVEKKPDGSLAAKPTPAGAPTWLIAAGTIIVPVIVAYITSH